MSERLTWREICVYALFIGLMSLLSMVSFGLNDSAVELLLKEGGVVETASAIGYFVCIVFLFYVGRSASMQTHWYLYVIFSAMALRELDFDKRFTETGVLQSKFLIAGDVGLFAKLFGGALLLLLVAAIVFWVRRHVRYFFAGVLSRRSSSWAAGFALFFIVMTKSIDGLARKLEPFGVEISAHTDEIASRFEEVFELGIPIAFLYAIYLHWRRHEAQDS